MIENASASHWLTRFRRTLVASGIAVFYEAYRFYPLHIRNSTVLEFAIAESILLMHEPSTSRRVTEL